MSIRVGGIDLGSAVINLEYELMRTQRILEWVINNNNAISGPSQNVMTQIEKEAFSALQNKYPDAGIQKK
jgi:hypothetical protein